MEVTRGLLLSELEVLSFQGTDLRVRQILATHPDAHPLNAAFTTTSPAHHPHKVIRG